MDTDAGQPLLGGRIGNPSNSAYAAGLVTKAPTWQGLVVWDLLFNSLTTGLFLVTASAELVAPEAFAAVAQVAYPTALGLLVADLLCLVIDLGDGRRFHYMLRVFKPCSPMSLGVWSLTVYSLPLTALAAMSLVPDGATTLAWARRLVIVAGFPFALAIAFYKGVLFSTNSQPGWKDARWLGGYLTSSAFLLGGAGLLALSLLLGQGPAVVIRRPALVLLLLHNGAMLALLTRDVRTAVSLAHSRTEMARLGALAGGAGLVLPLCLLGADGPFLLGGAVLLLMLGAVVVRAEIVRLPHVLAQVQKTSSPNLPWASETTSAAGADSSGERDGMKQ
jgi:hypothetical protein